MNCDCAFFIGADHKICQDYALCSGGDDSCAVVLSDGCSSSPDTDIGARLLVKAAAGSMSLIDVIPDPFESLDRYHQQTLRLAALGCNVIRLDPACLDATLMTIKANAEGFVVSCYGDGVFALLRRDGVAEIYSIDFADGYPHYLSYLLHPERHDEFEAWTSNIKHVTRQLLPRDGSEPNTRVSDAAVEFYYGSAADYLFAVAISDGIFSFTEAPQPGSPQPGRTLPLEDVLTPLLDFKNASGEFVQRRLQAFLRTCALRRWRHSDDLAMAAIYLGD
ncbi:hypothetical protein CCAX7_001460 [Capsulimonas corticalis]|uniref:PPM-type phosphatase domain-containing protein n=1 Tax=Capsulimonas corticalis TaxID=2219043 RepID=A0A402CRG0_9BACT|nr:protein phosphatase 2C domain-containing protein [Capsulimonas corticalis]BDI28095.1 hypothetical protein CCAX7_001460 [Capsulimonas corticalis]